MMWNRPIANLMIRAFAVLCAVMTAVTRCHAADWQWSVAVESATSGETNDHPRAFLWVPPNCQKVRAVVLGQHNMEEEPILEHPAFRAAMAELGFAEVWITPAIDLGFNADSGVGAHFEATMQALALESGYAELAAAPLVPVGHSASSNFPWAFALWKPQRTLAVLSVSGSFPNYRETEEPFTVPGLVTNGDYEAANNRIPDGLKQRLKHPLLPLSMIAEMGGGHFDCSDRKVEYLALYLKKVAQFRLDEQGHLKTIDPTKTGWLVDRWRQNDAPKAPAAPVGQYTGDPKEAFWYFDEELARATEEFHAYQRGLKPELLGYVQDGKVIEQNPNLHAQVRLRWLPKDDGVSFELGTTFLDAVPPGRPEGWSGLPRGSLIAHAASADQIVIHRICGPVRQTGPNTWSVRFYRMGMNNRNRSREIWFFADHPGDAQYKRAVQQAVLIIPPTNNAGQEQHITFPPVPDQPPDVKSLKLDATSDAGVPVYYYVREGPAEADGDTLRFTPIPPRAKLPVKVTVVAWQYGRSVEPKLKTAAPVERTFYLGQGASAPIAAGDDPERRAIWARAAQAVEDRKAEKAAAAARAVQAAEAAPNTISFNLCKTLGMRPTDLAGADARVGNWNNVKGASPGKTITLDAVIDKSGKPVPGMTVTFTGGRGGDSFDASTDDKATENDARLFNGLYDQFDGAPSTLVVSGIPYPHYDVYFYRFSDGENRGGSIRIGDAELTIRGGADPPAADGTGYVRATGNLQSGNYIRFENLTGDTLRATWTAVSAGDPVMRHKLVGFQIVERP